VLLALVAQAQHDPGTAAAFRERYLDPRRAGERALVEGATEAGEIAPRLAPDVALDALTGPILYRAMTGLGVPRGLVDTLVEDVLRPTRRR
jgi:hypothetical protein